MEKHIPLDDMADIFDLVYEIEYGKKFFEFTRITLELIKKHLPNGSKIIEFGAGSGRLSVPLSQEGYSVVAVDPSPSMLKCLRKKVKNKNLPNIRTINKKIEDFSTFKLKFDAALALFNVISYILDKESLIKSFHNVKNSIRENGIFILDVPKRNLFRSRITTKNDFYRKVDIVKTKNDDLYTYSEKIIIDGNKRKVRPFMIRYWRPCFVKKILKDMGFILIEEQLILSSKYFVFVKN